jgi:N-methylhydantoinase A/oxoprolinase/acetone carboxylase beta subunit
MKLLGVDIGGTFTDLILANLGSLPRLPSARLVARQRLRAA